MTCARGSRHAIEHTAPTRPSRIHQAPQAPRSPEGAPAHRPQVRAAGTNSRAHRSVSIAWGRRPLTPGATRSALPSPSTPSMSRRLLACAVVAFTMLSAGTLRAQPVRVSAGVGFRREWLSSSTPIRVLLGATSDQWRKVPANWPRTIGGFGTRSGVRLLEVSAQLGVMYGTARCWVRMRPTGRAPWLACAAHRARAAGRADGLSARWPARVRPRHVDGGAGRRRGGQADVAGVDEPRRNRVARNGDAHQSRASVTVAGVSVTSVGTPTRALTFADAWRVTAARGPSTH